MGFNIPKKYFFKRGLSEFSEFLKGSKIGVDASEAMYAYNFVYRDKERKPFRNSKGEMSYHIFGAVSQIIKFGEMDSKLCFVFDGAPEEEKRETIENRREQKLKYAIDLEEAIDLGEEELILDARKRVSFISHQEYSQLAEFLLSSGFDCYFANGEADGYLASLCKERELDGVISSDNDMIAHGVEFLIQKSGVILPEEFFKKLKVTREELVDCLALSGCDYFPGIKGLGVIKALKEIKKYGAEEAMNKNGVPIETLEMIRRIFLEGNPGTRVEGFLDLLRVTSILESLEFSEKRIKSYCELISKLHSKVFDGPTYSSAKNFHFGTLYNQGLKSILARSNRNFVIKGYDNFGLPNEKKVQEELGLKSGEEIIKFGRGKFLEAVEKRVRENTANLAAKFGSLFGHLNGEYKTLDPNYLKYSWRMISEIHKRKLLKRGFQLNPYCPNCETVISQSEIELKKGTHQSLIFSFKGILKGEEIFLLVYTDSPDTLPLNDRLIISEEVDYGVFSLGGKKIISRKDYFDEKLNGIWAEMVFLNPLPAEEIVKIDFYLPFLEEPRKPILTGAPYVGDKRTGAVHLAFRCAEIDHQFAIDHSLEILPLNAGTYPSGTFSGKKINSSTQEIIHMLEGWGPTFIEKSGKEISYCSRCGTRLAELFVEGWMIRTGGLKDEIIAKIEQIKWNPQDAKKRQLNFTEGIKDWYIDRSRDWGIPLPIFFSEESGEFEIPCLENLEWGSISELNHKLRQITLTSEKGFQLKWIGRVVDVWFDSGLALGYTGITPSHLIEGVDQTRGWFHSLLVLSCFGLPLPKNIFCHGWVISDSGKLSKSKGDGVEDFESLEAEKFIFDIVGASKFGISVKVSSLRNLRGRSLINTLLNLQNLPYSEESEPEIFKRYCYEKAYSVKREVRRLLNQGHFYEATQTFYDFFNEFFSKEYCSFFKQVGGRKIGVIRGVFSILRGEIFSFFPSLPLKLPFCPIPNQEATLTKPEREFCSKTFSSSETLLLLKIQRGFRRSDPLLSCEIPYSPEELAINLVKERVGVKGEVVFNNKFEIKELNVDDLEFERKAKNLVRQIQNSRKKLQMVQGEKIYLWVDGKDKNVVEAILIPELERLGIIFLEDRTEGGEKIQFKEETFLWVNRSLNKT